MNETNFDKRSTPAVVVEKTDQGMMASAINSDIFVDKVPVDVSLIHETPVGGTVAAVGPMNEVVVHPLPVVEQITQAYPVVTNTGSSMSLLTHEVSGPLRTRWPEIQGKFVDEPRTAVEQADTLVSDAIREITLKLTHEQSSIESQWKQDQDISTENLRKSLQNYRSFFNRLVS